MKNDEIGHQMAMVGPTTYIAKNLQVWIMLSTHIDENVNFLLSHYEKSQKWLPYGNGLQYDLLSIAKPALIWIKLSTHVDRNVNFHYQKKKIK